MRALLLALLLAFAGEAHAQTYPGTLLFEGAEFADFVCGASPTDCLFAAYAGTSSAFRSEWSRGAFFINGQHAGELQLPKPFAGQTTLWVHGWYCSLHIFVCPIDTVNPVVSFPRGYLFELYNSQHNVAVQVVGTGNAGQVAITGGNTSTTGGTWTTCPQWAFPLNSLQQIDFQFIYGAAGSAHFYVNGIDVCDYTGDTSTTDGATTITSAGFKSVNTDAGGGGVWSEVLIGTADTRTLRRSQVNIAGDGATVQWSPAGACANIWNRAPSSPNPVDDSQFANPIATPSINECTIAPSVPTGDYAVVGLGLAARARGATGGPAHLNWLNRIGVTDYTLTPQQTPNPAGINSGNMLIQTTNPATSAAWALSDFTSLQIGVQNEP